MRWRSTLKVLATQQRSVCDPEFRSLASTGAITYGDGRRFEIATHDDGSTWVNEIDQKAFPEERPSLLAEGPQKDAGAALADDGSTIDVMVVYSAKTRERAGGVEAMNRLIELAIGETNQRYSNSGIIQRLRLVYAAEVNYPATGNDIDTDLQRLSKPDDGFIDQIH